MPYWRNIEDGYSDPDIIAAQYQVGGTAYFEVQLTLAEYEDRIVPNSGGLQGSPTLIAALGGSIGPGCPEVNEYVWIGDEGQKPRAIKAKSLLKRQGDIKLYNPITGNFNLLIEAKLLKDRELFSTNTFGGVSGLTSTSHKVIVNTADSRGVSLNNYIIGGEVLRFQSNGNIYIDHLTEMSNAGVGDVIEIKLATEFIYVSGTTKQGGIVAHNRKDPIE